MSWLQRTAPDGGMAPKPRKWPAIVGVTAATWFLLSALLLMLLPA
jgi:hypothetical protein